MTISGNIITSRRYPSPNPHVRLTEITYWSDGLRVKGLLAEPIQQGVYEGILYLRGGIQNVGMVRPARIAQFATRICRFAPYYRGNRGGEGRRIWCAIVDAVYSVEVLRQFCGEYVHLFHFHEAV